jgi:hypothetical protein
MLDRVGSGTEGSSDVEGSSDTDGSSEIDGSSDTDGSSEIDGSSDTDGSSDMEGSSESDGISDSLAVDSEAEVSEGEADGEADSGIDVPHAPKRKATTGSRIARFNFIFFPFSLKY